MSVDRTGEQLGIDRQRPDCQALAVQRGGMVVREYADNDISASSGRRRPGYEALLADIEHGALDAVVAWSLDRLTRRVADLERLVDVCERNRVTVLLVRGSELDLATPAGRLVARLLGSVARHEVEQKSDRQKAEARQRAERGVPNGGRRPFGYDRAGTKLVDREAQAVADAYAALLAGRSLSGIAADLNQSGFTTTMRGPWKHNSVRLMLANPRNAGLRAHRGAVVGKGAWPAIVAEDTWRAALAILAEPARRTNGVGSARKWLGTRLYRCGHEGCTGLMISTYRQAGTRIYRCPRCGLSRRAEPIDAHVEAVVEARLSRADAADLLARSSDQDAGHLRTEALSLRERRRSVLALVADGTYTEAEARTEVARIAGRLAAVESALADTGRGDALGAILSGPDPVAAWRALGDAVDRKQAIVSALMGITLLPVPPGVRIFDPRSVAIEPAHPDPSTAASIAS